MLEQLADWNVDHVAAVVVSADGTTIETFGDVDRRFALASVTKPLTAWSTLIAVEEATIDWATPVGQLGCTLRHLLAHAGGYPFDGTDPVSRPERSRIYSNGGIELAADAVAERAAMDFGEYLAAAVFEPLTMASTTLEGSPAHGAVSTAADLGRFAVELLSPRLVSDAGASTARSIQYPDLAGIVPGVGKFDPCPWGLGFEIKGSKTPHWIADSMSTATFGHFGGAGTMLAVDPELDVAVIALGDRRFDRWPEALESWRLLTGTVAAELAR